MTVSNTSILILSYNRIEELKQTIPLVLQEIEQASAELIIVDNASTDGSVEYLRSVADKGNIRLILNAANLGVAGGRNAGYKLAKGDIIINLDDDTYPLPGLLEKTAAAFARHPNAGILAYRVRHRQTKDDQNPHGEHECEVANFHGAGHAFRKSVFLKAGYLDERCSFGGEELEMSIRARAAGYTVLYLPDIVVEHNSFPRPGGVGVDRRIQWRYNYTRVLHKYFPAKTAALFSWRLGFRDFVFGFRFGLRPWMRLWNESLRGRREGLQEYTPLSKDIMHFYMNPSLRPEYGNVPLIWKLSGCLGWQHKYNETGLTEPSEGVGR
ncbi:MAG: glycosyltransferase family 2 protein [Armatimonadota bacterium]|nr:glycosyltransferase family 2 protein [bacterium]